LFHSPIAFGVPVTGVLIAISFVTEKLEWCGYLTVKKFEDAYNRFDRIPACDGQTDKQTSCDGIKSAMHSIAP